MQYQRQQLVLKEDTSSAQNFALKMNSSSANQRNAIKFPMQMQQNKNRQSLAASPLPQIRKNKNVIEQFANQHPLSVLNKSNQHSPKRVGNKRSNSSQSKEQSQNNIMFVNQQHQLHRYQKQIQQETCKKQNQSNQNKISKRLFQNDSSQNIGNGKDNITYININPQQSNYKNQVTPAASSTKYRNSSQTSQQSSQINFFQEQIKSQLQNNPSYQLYQTNQYGESNQNYRDYNQNTQKGEYNQYLNELENNDYQQNDDSFYIFPNLDENGKIIQQNSKESLLDPDPELFVTNEVSTETKSQVTNESIQHEKTIKNENENDKQGQQIPQNQHIEQTQASKQQKISYLSEIQTNQILDNQPQNNQKLTPSSIRLTTRTSSQTDGQVQFTDTQRQQKKSQTYLNQQQAVISLNQLKSNSRPNKMQNKQQVVQPYIDFINPKHDKDQQNKYDSQFQSTLQKLTPMNNNLSEENTNQYHRNIKKYKVERRSVNSNYNNLSDYIENSNIQTLQDMTPQQFEEISCSMPIQTTKKVRSPNNYLSITQQSINSDSLKMGFTPSGISTTHGRSSVNAVYYQRQCNSVNRGSVRNSSTTKARFPSRTGSPQNHSFSSTRPNSNTEKAFQKIFRRRNPEHISVNSNNLFEENNESTDRSLNVKLLSIFKLYVIYLISFSLFNSIIFNHLPICFYNFFKMGKIKKKYLY